MLDVWKSPEGFCQLCPCRRPQLNIVAATEVRSISLPPNGKVTVMCSTSSFISTQSLPALLTLVNVCWHASRRRHSTCIRVNVTCTMALRGVLVCTTHAHLTALMIQIPYTPESHGISNTCILVLVPFCGPMLNVHVLYILEPPSSFCAILT